MSVFLHTITNGFISRKFRVSNNTIKISQIVHVNNTKQNETSAINCDKQFIADVSKKKII
jgi:hypothetical protein